MASSVNDQAAACIAHVKLVVDTKPETAVAGTAATESTSSALKHIAFEIAEDKLNVLAYELALAQKMLDNVDS